MGKEGASPDGSEPVATSAAEGDLRPGLHVTPNVRLTERLSEGAMGSVWVAKHLTLHTTVAVKFVSQALDTSDSEVLERFEREASTAAQIKSPYVVQTFDRGVMSDGTPYIVMEFLEGESLGARLAREGRLSLRDAGLIVTQVGRALSSAHHIGIVHRDIKPDNIFLTRGAEGLFCKVLDFGISKHTRQADMRSNTERGAVVGTPEFMSPEQLMGSHAVDYRADLWSLAVVAFCSITGRLPFSGASVGELCVNVLNAEFEPPSKLRDGVPTELDRWFLQALHKDPAERFPSAKDLVLAFVRVLSSLPDSSDLDADSGQFLLPPEVWEASAPQLSGPEGASRAKSPTAGPAAGRGRVPSADGAALLSADGAESSPGKRTLPLTGILAVAAGTGLALGVVLATILLTSDDGTNSPRDAAAGATASVGMTAGAATSESAEAWRASSPSTANSNDGATSEPGAAASAAAPDAGGGFWLPPSGKRRSTKSKTGHEALGF